MAKIDPLAPAGELLYGVAAIARFLGVTDRQALYLVEKSAFPFWKQDRIVCARRATLLAWIGEREQQATAERRKP